jgi:hypothetical protein
MVGIGSHYRSDADGLESQNFHTKAALAVCSARANLPPAYNKDGDLRQNKWVSPFRCFLVFLFSCDLIAKLEICDTFWATICNRGHWRTSQIWTTLSGLAVDDRISIWTSSDDSMAMEPTWLPDQARPSKSGPWTSRLDLACKFLWLLLC